MPYCEELKCDLCDMVRYADFYPELMAAHGGSVFVLCVYTDCMSLSKTISLLVMVAHTFSPSTREAEAG